MSVIETDVAAVQLSEAGAPGQVNSYRVGKMLGEGAFSRVYECENSEGQQYALKILNKSFLKRKREYKRVDGKLVLSNAFQKVQKEVAIMKKLSHTHLVKLHEVIDSPADDKMFLVLDLIRGGQVMDWDDKAFRYTTSRTETGVLGRAAVRDCLRDVVTALDYLHRNRICHRDIKPENILLAGTSEGYKLADFGVAHMLDPEDGEAQQSMLRSTEGTYHFLAPECTTGDAYDPFMVDIWALGVTMFAMLNGSLPFGAKAASLSDVMTAIREDALVIPDKIAPECTELLERMLTKNPADRITIPELMVHPWLSSTDAIPPTPRGVENDSDPDIVEVTAMEIEAAFTPVNNFILMTKLKMKLGSRLARMRRSIDAREGLYGSGGAHARRLTQPRTQSSQSIDTVNGRCASDKAVLAMNSLVGKQAPPCDENEDPAKLLEGEPVPSGFNHTKEEEILPTEESPGKASPEARLQKRKSTLGVVLTGTIEAITTLKPAGPERRRSDLSVLVTPTASLPSPTRSDGASTSEVRSSIAPVVPRLQLPVSSTENAATSPTVGIELTDPASDPLEPVVPPTNPVCKVSIDVSSIFPTVRADLSSGLAESSDTSHCERSRVEPQLVPPRQYREGRRTVRRHSTLSDNFRDASEPTAGLQPVNLSPGETPNSRTIMRRKSSIHPPTARDEYVQGHQGSSENMGFASDQGAINRSPLDISPPKVRRLQKISVSPKKAPSPINSCREELELTSSIATLDDAILNAGTDPTSNHSTHPEPSTSSDTNDIISTSNREMDESMLTEPNESPQLRLRPNGHRSHPTLQAKLPPLDINSAPSSPTKHSPLTSPAVAGSTRARRRASIDNSLHHVDEPDSLASLEMESGTSPRSSPSRRHSVADRSLKLGNFMLPAVSAGSGSSSASGQSSPRPGSVGEGNECTPSDATPYAVDSVDAFNDEWLGPTNLLLARESTQSVDLGYETEKDGLTFSALSRSTPQLPHYGTHIYSTQGTDISQHSTTNEAMMEASKCLGGSSSTGALSPRYRPSSPLRPLAIDTPASSTDLQDPPPSPPRRASMDGEAGPIIRMSSLAKALDDCMTPEENAEYYSSRANTAKELSTSTEAQKASESNADSNPRDMAQSPPRPSERRRNSLLETQDSLKMMRRGHSAVQILIPSSPKSPLKRFAMAGSGGKSSGQSSLRSSICLVM